MLGGLSKSRICTVSKYIHWGEDMLVSNVIAFVLQVESPVICKILDTADENGLLSLPNWIKIEGKKGDWKSSLPPDHVSL